MEKTRFGNWSLGSESTRRKKVKKTLQLKTWDLNNKNSHKEKNEQEEMGICPALG